ncbi:hypothetical protein [Megalodesulfovibrio gigas]|nr:hypothetical protein [Megalodesulfovibrio gigas]
MHRFRAFCLAVALGLSLVAAVAAQAQALTAATVEGFIRSIQEIQPLYEQSGSQQDINKDTVDADDKNWNIRDWLAQAALEPRVLAILKKHGFQDQTQWADVATRVMQAYTTIRLGAEGLNARAQMQAGLAELEQQPGLSAEQKAMLRQQMQQGMQQMDQMLEEAPKADQDAVRPFMTQLDAVFEVEE